MANMLLTTHGTSGDLIPFLGLGSVLKARGHEVTLLTHCYYADVVGRAGLDFVALDCPEAHAQFIEDGPLLNTPQGIPLFFQRNILPGVLSEYDLIRERCRAQDTVLVTDHRAGVAALIAAEKLRLPVARVFIAVSQVTTMSLFEELCRTVLAADLNRIRAQVGLAAVRDWGAWVRSPQVNVASWPDWFAVPEASWPLDVLPVGFIKHDAVETGTLPAPLAEFLDDGEPPVLITGGTGTFLGTEFYAASAGACQLLGRRAVLVTRHKELVPRPLPDRIKWFEYLPFASLLPRVAAVVHHGGTSTLARALAAAVPQLALAAWGDRPDTALHLERLGVAEFLPPPRWQPETVAQALQRLTHSSAVQERCRELAQRLRDADPTAAACRAIEGLVPGRAGGEAASLERDRLLERVDGLAPEKRKMLALLLKKKRSAPKRQSAWPAIVPDPDQKHRPFPLTDVQYAYWIGRGEAFELGNVACHAYIEVESDELDVVRFERVWQRLIERHDMLRVVVRPDGQQQILEDLPLYQIEVLDLRGQAPEAVTARLEAIRQRMSHQKLDSERWPLFEIRASWLDGGRVRLHLSIDALISDVRGGHILGRELVQLYRDPATVLPPLALSFRDYVLAEMDLRETELYQRALTYWRDRLPALPPAPELPLAKEPGSLTRPQFVRREARLSPGTWQRLKDRAAQAELTPAGVLLAAFAEVLATWSKEPHFALNLTLFNLLPLHPQVNEIVGDFTSLILLAVDNAGVDQFEARAQRWQEQLLEGLSHRYVSGVRVLRELAQVKGDAQKAAMPVVFTSGLNLTEPGQETAGLDSLGDIVYSISQTPQVYLDNQVREQEGALIFNWDAVEALFPAGLLDDMFGAYCHLLQRLAEDEAAWREQTWQLVPAPAAQRAQRATVNATAAPLSGELLHTLFAAQAAQRPEQTAVTTSDRRLSYGELHRRANQVGHWLRQRGAQPNRLVAVVMEKGWEQVVAVLGVLNAGAAYLPVDPDLPSERVTYLLEHGQVELALTQPWLEERLAWPEGIERLSVADEALAGLDESPLTPLQDVTDLAYVIFTSGSTGLPKGVMIDHRGAVNTILDINQRFGVTPEDRVFAISQLNFDLSVYDVFGPLAAGGAIVLPDAAARRDPAHWLALMRQERVTLWDSVPALMELLVEYVEGRGEELPASLRLVFMSGDWIPVTLPDRIRALAEGVAIWSGGGATEASIWSILYPIKAVEPDWASIPYGKPMLNQSFHVLDGALSPRPVWVPGELYIGGAGLAQGYWRDEEKTAASFIAAPPTLRASPPGGGSEGGGERLYRTGDLGRYLPDGNIEFLGREDFQVKIRGHRIELGEVEAALLQHPAVQAGVVTAAGLGVSSAERRPRSDKRLVAYVVPDQASLPGDEAAAQDYVPQETEGIILDPIERLRFKLAHPGLRRDDGHPSGVQLARPELDEAALAAYVARRSYRKFDAQPVPLEAFGRLLSGLSALELQDVPLPKYRYGSAGSLYPVQVYLYVKPGRVEGIAGGAYYYHPYEHRLVLLSDEMRLQSDAFLMGNREVYEGCAFALFLVGQLDAIEPLYGEWARDFCLLEAGLMTQLLEQEAPAQQIGLCQIGGFDFGPLRDGFTLGEGHVYLHGLLGGRVTVEQTQLPALVEDAGPLRTLLQFLPEEGGREAPAAARAGKPGQNGRLVEELAGFMREKLPAYMVPSAFVLLEALPLTANGKVDRQALPAPEMGPLEPEKGFVAPQSELERAIAGAWQEVLGVERVGVHDSFFALGGTSVHVVRVQNRLREVVGEELPIVKLFEHPTIHALAQYVGAGQARHPALEQSGERGQARKASRRRRRARQRP